MNWLKGAPRMFYESAKLWWMEGRLGLALAACFVVGVVLFVWFS